MESKISVRQTHITNNANNQCCCACDRKKALAVPAGESINWSNHFGKQCEHISKKWELNFHKTHQSQR